MVSKIRSLGIHGVGGYEVSVECSLSNGLPAFDIVGLPDAAVKEARERVRAAIKNCGLSFPVSRLTINLAPADKKKAGTVYDLPVLLGILSAAGAIPPLPETAACFGELGLTGELRPVRGTLPMALAARRGGITELYVPEGNAAEASYADGLEVFPVKDVSSLLRHMTGEERIEPLVFRELLPGEVGVPDFSEVKGQENVKRALEVAAAGLHNVLLVGPPGSGKSMLAKRLPGILPDMSRDEALESTEIWSVAGFTDDKNPVLRTRPFRAPHHTITSAAMAGGGRLQPGEVSLAHNGVLFLDELPEFGRETLEVLRQPLEDGRVTISRMSGTATFPSEFMLVCAMNPCRCGWYGHRSGQCSCSEASVRSYNAKISGPLLDRIDIIVEVPSLEYDELRRRPDAETSADVKKRVNAARKQQQNRQGSDIMYNARMDQSAIAEHCALSPECEKLMKGAFDRMNLTARSYDRILRVSRTIADLAGEENILPMHLAEAVQYRTYSFS